MRVTTESPWPAGSGDVIFIADAPNAVERDLLTRWIVDTEPEGSGRSHQVVEADTSRLLVTHPTRWTADPTSSAVVVPLRVSWAPVDMERAAPRLRDLILGNPHSPSHRLARYLKRRHPERIRLLSGASASSTDLAARYERDSASPEAAKADVAKADDAKAEATPVDPENAIDAAEAAALLTAAFQGKRPAGTGVQDVNYDDVAGTDDESSEADARADESHDDDEDEHA